MSCFLAQPKYHDWMKRHAAFENKLVKAVIGYRSDIMDGVLVSKVVDEAKLV